jgi:hypothetical protein
MSADRSGPEVAGFGDDERAPVAPSQLHRLATAVLGDRRLVPLLAGFAALAAFGSLVGEWFHVNPGRGQFGESELRAGINEAGAFGTTYLVGLVALTVAVGLVLFGPPQVRGTARAAGLALAGALVALVLATRMTVARDVAVSFEDAPVAVAYGRGLAAAFLATLLAGSALYLAGRFLPAAAAGPAAADPSADPSADPPADGRRTRGRWPDWSRRRPRSGARADTDDEVADAPLDLTVEPASPFAHPEADERPDGR